MPAKFDRMLQHIKDSGSTDNAYAVAVAQWKKTHGGRLPSGKFPKSKEDEGMADLDNVNRGQVNDIEFTAGMDEHNKGAGMEKLRKVLKEAQKDNIPEGATVRILYGNFEGKTGKVKDTAAADGYSIVTVAGQKITISDSDLKVLRYPGM